MPIGNLWMVDVGASPSTFLAPSLRCTAGWMSGCGRESITGTVFSGSHLPRLPTDRQVAHLTRGRLIVDYLGQTVGSLSCYITWEMVRHRTATHDCRVRLSYLCRVIESVQKIIFPVGEKFFSNWRNSSLIKGFELRIRRVHPTNAQVRAHTICQGDCAAN